jgi:hypothetical protein
MAYAILRTQKLKHAVAVRRSMAHALRTQDTPNADPNRTPNNSASVGSVEEALSKFNERLATQTKLRSNAVLAVEYLVTGSPEDLNGKTQQQQDAYFADALKWLEAKHGKENVVAWGIHRDETTPHLYAVVVPIDDKGKLNCRHFLGGTKALNEMQTDFAQKVGQQHGLQRGIEGSKAKHTSIQTYYARVNSAIPKAPSVDVPEPNWGDKLSPADYGKKVASSVLDQLRPTWNSLQAKAGEMEAAQVRAKAAEDAARLAQETAKQLRERADSLSATAHKQAFMLALFTPDEMQAAGERRRQQDAEKARRAEIAQQQAIEAAKRDEIDAEVGRRIEALKKPTERLYGAANVYQEAAKSALLDAGGDASQVNWGQVDGHAAAKAIRDHGQKPDEVAKVLLERSPLLADPANHHRLESWIERNAATLQEEYRIARAARDSGYSKER